VRVDSRRAETARERLGIGQRMPAGSRGHRLRQVAIEMQILRTRNMRCREFILAPARVREVEAAIEDDDVATSRECSGVD
jgi:hypothetical protein